MRLVLILLAVVLFPVQAWAYSAPARYTQDPMQGGAGGRFFTGSTADNFTCSVCHEDAMAGPQVKVSGLPKGGYEAGAVYPIRVTWEPGPLETEEDTITIVAEMLSPAGEATGTITLPPMDEAEADSLCVSGVPASEVMDGGAGRSIVAMSACGAKQLHFLWTAPEEPVELDACAPEAVLYLAAMQGDESEDPTGDALTLAQRSVPSSAACEEELPPAEACRVGGSGGSLGALLLVLLALGRRRERTT